MAGRADHYIRMEYAWSGCSSNSVITNRAWLDGTLFIPWTIGFTAPGVHEDVKAEPSIWHHATRNCVGTARPSLSFQIISFAFQGY